MGKRYDYPIIGDRTLSGNALNAYYDADIFLKKPMPTTSVNKGIFRISIKQKPIITNYSQA